MFTLTGREVHYWGTVSIVAHIDGLLRTSDSPAIRPAIRGKDALGAHGEMVDGDASVFASQPLLMDIEVPGGSWQLAAVPQHGWQNTSAVWFVLFSFGPGHQRAAGAAGCTR